MAVKKSGLGRGLDALFADVSIEEPPEKKTDSKKIKKSKESGAEKKSLSTEEILKNTVFYIDINDIEPNKDQPRKSFNEEKIAELADSILQHGIIQPLVVREKSNGYELIAGERRWRAARKAGLKKVPTLVREVDEKENALLAIIENMQREDLNPIDEAKGIENMIDNYGLTQLEVSKSLGKSRPYITNALRLLNLPEEIKDLIVTGEISSGHGRAVLAVKNKKKQLELCERIKRENLSVRAVETIVGNIETTQRKRKTRIKTIKDPNVAFVEEKLKNALGTKVSLKENGKKGFIEIEYFSSEELERLIELLTNV